MGITKSKAVEFEMRNRVCADLSVGDKTKGLSTSENQTARFIAQSQGTGGKK